MKMVSAAKLRRAQEQAEAARPYAEPMEKVLGSLIDEVPTQVREREQRAAGHEDSPRFVRAQRRWPVPKTYPEHDTWVRRVWT